MPTIEERLDELESVVAGQGQALSSTRLELDEAVRQAAPVGSIEAYGGRLSPALFASGWLPCDGTPLRSNEWPDLFAAIGQLWGQGGGTPNPDLVTSADIPTDFNLPRLGGRFLRGATADSDEADLSERSPLGTGASTEVGSVQPDMLKNHAHDNFSSANGDGAMVGSPRKFLAGGNIGHGTNNEAIIPTGGPENRPRNAYVNFIIKAGRRVSL